MHRSDGKTTITVAQAMRLAAEQGYTNLSRATVIKWAKKYGLGIKMGAGQTNKFIIDVDKFVTAVKGLWGLDGPSIQLLKQWEAENASYNEEG